MVQNLLELKVEGLVPLEELLDKLPDEAKNAAGESIGKFIYNAVHEEPPQKEVTRREAYGVTFFSPRQRRWFFANFGDDIKKGKDITYKRTGTFGRGWQIVGSGINTKVINNTDYGPYLMGNEEQSRMSALIGWKKLEAIIPGPRDKFNALKEAGVVAIQKWLDKAVRRI